MSFTFKTEIHKFVDLWIYCCLTIYNHADNLSCGQRQPCIGFGKVHFCVNCVNNDVDINDKML